MRKYTNVHAVFACAVASIMFITSWAYADEESTRNVLKQGLLGAGVGAVSAGASKGNAGQGALIGAGTAVIGGALLDAITAPPQSSRRNTARSAPPPDDNYYTDDSEEYYVDEPPRESGTQKVLKQGLLGAGTGALAAGVSGGNAGQGALIGAGTSVIGSALLDAITEPPQQTRRAYRRAAPAPQQQPRAQYKQVQTQAVDSTDDTATGSHKKIIKKYDDSGKLVSEEEIYY